MTMLLSDLPLKPLFSWYLTYVLPHLNSTWSSFMSEYFLLELWFMWYQPIQLFLYVRLLPLAEKRVAQDLRLTTCPLQFSRLVAAVSFLLRRAGREPRHLEELMLVPASTQVIILHFWCARFCLLINLLLPTVDQSLWR